MPYRFEVPDKGPLAILGGLGSFPWWNEFVAATISVNDFVVTVAAILVAILTVMHMFFKIRGQRLANRHQSLENEMLQKKIEQTK